MVFSRKTCEITSCKMKRKSDLDFKLNKLELKTISIVSVPHFAAVDINSCSPLDFVTENFAEYFIHFIELEFEKLEKTLKIFVYGNLETTMMLKQFRR